jgi:hypothetical protein
MIHPVFRLVKITAIRGSKLTPDRRSREATLDNSRANYPGA